MDALQGDVSRKTIPTGTVTFVFTDIEGSTQRWDRNRGAMQDALRRHDEVMRGSFAAHGGYVFKTIGDAFCAAFARPEAAIASMFDATRALDAEDFSGVGGLRVRAAIHTGTADERDRDYFGPAVNRAARLLGLAHGGQVLVSGVTSDLVQNALPPDLSLRDLGEHRLKDLSHPERVFQLVGPKLIAEFAPLLSLDVLPNNLPLNLTSFLGRQTEIAEIADALAAHRLVTIVGSGGVGKTRTSLQVAANALDGSGDGVWFVELAPLGSGDYIAPAVAQTLGVKLAADGDQVDHLARALATKRLLLVFDNCEHLVDGAARVIAALLRGCPGVKVLASTRQSLGIAGEVTYRMPSLEVPHLEAGATLSAGEAVACAAIALFVERARAADRHFRLTDDDAPIVADICRRLDGIALAIELAASRIKLLSPRQLRDRLNERFRLLTGGGRDVLPRQQTLRATIDWSHDLLDERERMLLRRLAVFVDGFTLEAATTVASGDDLDEFDVFDLMASLVEKSLVIADQRGDAVRYRMLESTRAYAAEKLAHAGERDSIASRQLRFVRDLFSGIHERLEQSGRVAEQNEIFEIELGNVRAALDDALTRSDIVAGAELLAVLESAWPDELDREGASWNEAYLDALPEGEELLRSQLCTTLAGILSTGLGAIVRAHEVATRGCAHARVAGDGPTLCAALRGYAEVSARLLLEDADAALAEAATIPVTSRRLRAKLIETRAFLSSNGGDLDAAADAYEEAAAYHRELGNLRATHGMTMNLAEVEHERGRTPRAIALVRGVLPSARNTADTSITAGLLTNLAGYLATTGELSAASDAVREVIALYAREPEYYLVTQAIEHLALVLALQGRYSDAIRLATYAESALENISWKRQFTEQTSYLRRIALLTEHTTPEERTRPTTEGAALSPAAAVALALQETERQP